jgi:UDP-glucose 4-epimerase
VDALLERGHEVTVVDDFSLGSEANLQNAQSLVHAGKGRLHVVRASLADEAIWDTLPAMDAVLHFAAQTSVTKSVSDAAADFRANVSFMPSFFNWLRRNKVRAVIYSNTAGSLYGEPIQFPTDERALVQPLSPYGATKSFFETYLASLCASLKAVGEWSRDPREVNYFSWVSLRLGNVYGPRQKSVGEAAVVPTFLDLFMEGQTPNIFGDGNKTRDYVYVGDVVQAFLLALDKLQTTNLDECFNVASASETKDIEVFKTVRDVLAETLREKGLKRQAPRDPTGVQPNFAKVRPGEVTRSYLAINKIDGFLGWLPSTRFEDGVRQTVRAYLGL